MKSTLLLATLLAAASCSTVVQVTGTGGTGGAGGTGGTTSTTTTYHCVDVVQPCAADSDCYAAPGACLTGACQNGCCALGPAPAGTPCAQGTCDGSGTCMNGGCLSDAECGVVDLCTVTTCDLATGMCIDTPLPDGTPTPGKLPFPGDCHTPVCVGGMDTSVVDDTNLPAIPAGLAGCADAKCTMGVPSNPLHAVDSTCSTYMGSMPGHCTATGQCLQCLSDSECPGSIDDCQHPACTAATCVMVFAPAGTPTTTNPPQIPGDCHKIVCDGAGSHHSIVDDTDAPSSGTVCITDTCSNGIVIMLPDPGVVCGTSMGLPTKCNAAGTCDCVTNAECTPPQTCHAGGACL